MPKIRNERNSIIYLYLWLNYLTLLTEGVMEAMIAQIILMSWIAILYTGKIRKHIQRRFHLLHPRIYPLHIMPISGWERKLCPFFVVWGGQGILGKRVVRINIVILQCLIDVLVLMMNKCFLTTCITY